MDDDYAAEDYETSCPKCGHSPTMSQRCAVVGCDDGWIDMYEYDDPMLFSPGEEEPCQECHGVGILRWCPACGADLNRSESCQRQLAPA